MPMTSSSISPNTPQASHLFNWHAQFNHGAACRGHYWAYSATQVRHHLHHQGLQPKTIHREPRWRTRISAQDLHWTTVHLTTLLRAGLPLNQALDMTIQQQTKQPLKQLLLQVLSSIQQGQSLSQSLAPFPQYFDGLHQQLISAGEASGQLPLMLSRLSQHQTKQHDIRQRLKQALLYPLCIICVGIIVMLGLLLGLMPRFEQLFLQLEAPLPPLTEALFYVSHRIRDWGGILLFTSVGLLYWNRHRRWPVIHSLKQQAAWVRFAHTLATLLASGLPLLKALESAIGSADQSYWRAQWPALSQSLQVGQSLHQSLQEAEILPTLLLDMIKIGEQTGNLPDMLNKAADYYEDRLTHQIQQWLTLLEPLTLVLLATLVGTMILAIYMPLFQLGSVF